MARAACLPVTATRLLATAARVLARVAHPPTRAAHPLAKAACLLATICTGAAFTQEEAPLPPRVLEDSGREPRTTDGPSTEAPLPPNILDDPPGQASLARLPPDREEVLEEVVVVGRERWRLPDLGATWRTRFERPPETRLAMRYLPLYDPEMAELWPDLFQLSKQEERTGHIELFRIRFGAEARQATVPTVLNPDP